MKKIIEVLSVFPKGTPERTKQVQNFMVKNLLQDFRLLFTHMTGSEFLQTEDSHMTYQLVIFDGAVLENEYSYMDLKKMIYVINTEYNASNIIALSGDLQNLITAELIQVRTYIHYVKIVKDGEKIIDLFWAELALELKNNTRINVISLPSEKNLRARKNLMIPIYRNDTNKIEISNNEEILDDVILISPKKPHWFMYWLTKRYGWVILLGLLLTLGIFVYGHFVLSVFDPIE